MTLDLIDTLYLNSLFLSDSNQFHPHVLWNVVCSPLTEVITFIIITLFINIVLIYLSYSSVCHDLHKSTSFESFPLYVSTFCGLRRFGY